MRTFGVEEELLLVDGGSGLAMPAALEVLERYGPDGILTKEFKLEQIEVVAQPHELLQQFSVDLHNCRAEADAAARAAGARTAALGTYPMEVLPHPHPDPRYAVIGQRYGLTSAEQLTCSCHVHVGVDSDEEGVAVLDRIRIWLPVVLALSANSPFWQGQNTQFFSFRPQTWQRLPATGPCEMFGSAAAYWKFLQHILDTGVPPDKGTIYFDARLSLHHPTVEVRVADVCLEPEDTVLIAALVRALVETAVRDWKDGRTPEPVPATLLRIATWRSCRWGLAGPLLDPVSCRPRPVLEVVEALREHVGPVLDESGDETVVGTLLEAVLERGTGADRQYAVLEQTGSLADVVLDAIETTNRPGLSGWKR